MSKNFLNQIEQLLERPENRNVAALVNESTEQIHVFVAPRPYWQTNDAADTGKLTAEEVKSLESERGALIDSLARLNRAERSKATTRIAVIESELRRGRSNEESARTDRERVTERKQEAGGTPPVSGNTNASGKLTWASLRAELDAKTKTFMSRATQTVCCEGQYKCAKCRAKSAA